MNTGHQYELTLKHLTNQYGEVVDVPALVIQIQNHDDILRIVRMFQAQSDWSADEAAAFVVGMKLFGETMLMHKDHPLFTEFKPHFQVFMKHLKTTLKKSDEHPNDNARSGVYLTPSSMKHLKMR